MTGESGAFAWSLTIQFSIVVTALPIAFISFGLPFGPAASIRRRWSYLEQFW